MIPESKCIVQYLPHDTKVRAQYRRDMLAFIECITKIMKSSKSYTHKIYVGAYPRDTSIIVLR
jgi:hypothetical protein